MKKLISIVVSLYNEEGNVIELYTQLKEVLLKLSEFDHEIIFVNDGSKDSTLAICLDIMGKDDNVKIMNLFRNFGHEVAMSSGMRNAKGDVLIFMDGDLQHPPSIIYEMIQKWQSGKEVVLTRRIDNVGVSMSYKLFSRIYYYLINKLSDVTIPKNTPDFRLINRKYVNLLTKLNEKNSMFRGLLMLVGIQNVDYIDFIAPKRFHGKTKYNFTKSIQLAVDSIIQFSIKPLRFATYVGVLSAVVSVLFGVYTIVEYFLGDVKVSGYPTIICLTVFMASIQMIILGILGEYIGRIHLEVKNRPMYFGELLSNDDHK